MSVRSKRNKADVPLTTLLAVLLMLTACTATSPSGDTAIDAVCREWGRALPTRSRQDTLQTQQEFERLYRIYDAVCGNK